MVLLALALGSGAAASDLSVQDSMAGGNVNTGQFAALVAVSSSCTAELHEVVTGAIASNTYTGCSTLASDGDVAGGATVNFRAGSQIRLQNGFSVPAGATLSVAIQSALFPDAWVQDDTPDGETVYSARFYIDPSDLNLTGSDRFYHFVAFDSAGNPELRVGIKQNGTERRLFLEVFDDNGSFQSTEGVDELMLPNVASDWHWVEVGWMADTAPGATNGMAQICANGGCALALSGGLDNDTGAIDFVRWGAIDVPSDTGLGNLDLDDFESRSSLNIGPLP
jgi:hypothetical protein